MSAPEWEEIGDDELEVDEDETGFVGGGGPATTWEGGDHGEDDAHLADTDHEEV